MPSATSSAMDPVGMIWIGTRVSSPRRITEPLPNCLSIWASATSSAFSRSSAGIGSTFADSVGLWSALTLERPADSFSPAVRSVDLDPRCGQTSRRPVRESTRHAGPDRSTYPGRRAAVGVLDPDAGPLRSGVRPLRRARPRPAGARRPYGRPGAGRGHPGEAGVAGGLRGVRSAGAEAVRNGPADPARLHRMHDRPACLPHPAVPPDEQARLAADRQAVGDPGGGGSAAAAGPGDAQAEHDLRVAG